MSSSLTISPKAFNEAIETTERLKNKLTKIQSAGEAKAGLVVGGATVVAVEGLAGYMRGRYGEKQIGPVNAEVTAGVACEVLALMGIFGKWSESIAMVGHATIGFAIGMEAMKIGERHAREAERGAPARERRAAIDTAGEEIEDTRREAPIQKRSAEKLPPRQRRVDLRRPASTMADDVAVEETEPAVKTGT